MKRHGFTMLLTYYNTIVFNLLRVKSLLPVKLFTSRNKFDKKSANAVCRKFSFTFLLNQGCPGNECHREQQNTRK